MEGTAPKGLVFWFLPSLQNETISLDKWIYPYHLLVREIPTRKWLCLLMVGSQIKLMELIVGLQTHVLIIILAAVFESHFFIVRF